jgi:palmitoyltransferase ZDHHC13/17
MRRINNVPTWADSLDDLPPHATRDAFGVAMFGSVALMRRVLRDDAAALTRVDKSGNSVLHWAAFRNSATMCRLLLDAAPAPAAVNAVNATEGASVLHWACIAGNVRVVHLLRLRGADMHAADKRGYNALHHAVQHNRLLVALYVLRCGVSVDSIDAEGHTALHWAAYSKHADLCRFLVNVGAAVDERDDAGYTALRWAVEQSDGPTALELMRLGASRTLADTSGATPLQVAQLLKSDSLAALLQHDEAESKRVQRRAELFWRAVVCGGVTLLLGAPVVALVYVAPVLGVCGAAYAAVRGTKAPAWLPTLGNNDETPTQVLLLLFWLAYAISFVIWISDIRPSILADVEAAAAAGEAVPLPFTRLALDLFTALSAVHCACAAVAAFRSPGLVGDAHLLKNGDAPLAAALDDDDDGAPLPQLCVTCMKWRPVRSKHCRVLNQCVLRFDHYCVWINNSVGARNHGAFFVFLVLCVLLHNWLAVWCVRLLWIRGEFQWALPASPRIWTLLVFHLLNGFWELSVLALQLQCAVANLTTNELINRHRYEYFNGGNPFDRGTVRNVLEMLTGRGGDCENAMVIKVKRTV